MLNRDEEAQRDWEKFRALRHIYRGNHAGAKTVHSKKRYINPYVQGMGRVKELSASYALALNEFMADPLDEPLWGE